jgi:hypothetical protein
MAHISLAMTVLCIALILVCAIYIVLVITEGW